MQDVTFHEQRSSPSFPAVGRQSNTEYIFVHRPSLQHLFISFVAFSRVYSFSYTELFIYFFINISYIGLFALRVSCKPLYPLRSTDLLMTYL